MNIPLPEAEFEWSYARAGGPGGQNVNKVASKAVLRWNLSATAVVPEHVKTRLARLFPSRTTAEGWIVIASQSHRDQERNREACREKLAEMLRTAATLPKPRVKTKPGPGANRKRLQEKKRAAARRARRTVEDE